MFESFHFEKMNRLPNYVFAVVNEIKLRERRAGKDVIDFSMGNPDGDTPKHIQEKLIEATLKSGNHGYSSSKGIYKLRLAISDWYKRRYGVNIDPEKEAIATMGSKEGYVHLVEAITNVGDIAIVPEPTYPIHSYAFTLAGAAVRKMEIKWNSKFELDEERFFEDLQKAIKESVPKPKFVVVNFPHNPTTVTVTEEFFDRLVFLAKKEEFYIISDIAYADLTFDGYKAPSIFSVPDAKEVAVESFTLSKSYNMAGWRVGFMVGNRKLIQALEKIKSWIDYGMFTPIQVAATVALNGDQSCVEEIRRNYEERRDFLVDSFSRAGWKLSKPKATMFVWAKIPEKLQYMGSLEFSKKLLLEAQIAVSPGIGFGEYGDQYVRIALIENRKRIRQAARNVKKFLQMYES
jgi:alanine-synthesizing transaminase